MFAGIVKPLEFQFWVDDTVEYADDVGYFSRGFDQHIQAFLQVGDGNTVLSDLLVDKSESLPKVNNAVRTILLLRLLEEADGSVGGLFPLSDPQEVLA